MKQNDKEDRFHASNGSFAFAREPRQTGASLVVNDDATAWEIYNNRALKVDKELIKDWNDSLNTLLIFAALYSAVQTAFIIESMKLLQEDSIDISRNVLLAISKQLANSSEGAYKAETFFAPAFAVRVDCYFFLSISFSLVAALGAVLALQWVGSYDAGLNQSSPEERALQRHFRHHGVQTWKMVQIIAFLPVLIFIALFLFFVGLAEWLWNVHRGVAGIVIATLICGATFFFVTTIISMIHPSAPFRTPASRSLPRIFAQVYSSLVESLRCFSTMGTGTQPPSKEKTPFFTGRSTVGQRLPDILKVLNDLLSSYRVYAPYISGQIEPFVRPFGHYIRAMLAPRLIGSFDMRETAQIHSIVDLKRTALLSLASSLDVLPHTANQFRAVIREVLLLPPNQLVDPIIENAPWESIFDLLLDPYLRAPWEEGLSDKEVADLEPILQAYSLICTIPALQFPSSTFFDVVRATEVTSIQTVALLIEVKLPRAYSYLFDDLCVVFASMECLPTHFLVAHLMNLQKKQKEEPNQDNIAINFSGRGGEARRSLAQIIYFNLTTLDSVSMPEPLQDILFDILALRYMKTEAPGETPIERYSHAIETFLREEPAMRNKRVARDIHNAIISQTLGNMLQKLHRPKHTVLGPDMLQLARLLHASPPSSHSTQTIEAIFRIFRSSANTLWSGESQLQTAQLYALLLPMPYSFSGDWSDWRTRFYVGLQILLEEKDWFSASSRQLIWEQARMEARGNNHETALSHFQLRRVSVLQDPVLLLYLSSGTNHLWGYPSFRITIGTKEGEELDSAIEHWCDAMIWQTDGNNSLGQDSDHRSKRNVIQ